jgi:acyl carrier protein
MVSEKLDQLIGEVFDDDAGAIGDETLFAACPSWDSLKHAALIVGIESRFGVELSADEIRRLTCKRIARELLAAKGIV